MNFVDIGILIVLTYNAITGLRRGFTQIISNLIALTFGVTLAMANYQFAAGVIYSFTGMKPPWVYYLGFALVWGVVFLIVSLIGKIVEKVLKFSYLGPLNTVGGFIFGVVKGVVILLPVLMPMVYFKTAAVQQSLLIEPFKPLIAYLLNNVIGPDMFDPQKLLSSKFMRMISMDITMMTPDKMSVFQRDFKSAAIEFFRLLKSS